MEGLRHILANRRALLWWLATAAAWLGVSWLTDAAGLVVDGVPLIVPAAGVAFTAVQLGGPWLATALFAAGVGEGFRMGPPVGAALLLGVSAAATGFVPAAVTRRARLRSAGERFTDSIIRVFAGAAGAVVGGSLMIAALASAGGLDRIAARGGTALLAFFAGTLVVSPFVRSWLQRGSRGVAGRAEWAALLLTALGVSTLVSTGALGDAGPTAYLVFPVVVWAALRTGRMGVSAVLVITAIAAAASASSGHGPFADASPEASAFILDSFLVILALTGLLLVGLELERRVTATGLTEAEERHRRLIEQLPLVTYMRELDPVTPPTFVSPQTIGLFGYPMEAWTSEPYFARNIVHADDRVWNAELNQRSLTEDLVMGEYRMIAADGRVVWVLDHMIAIRNDAGEVVGQQGFVIDITERKELEEQLVRAQRMEALGLLAGGVAHDFNNLLAAISGYTQLADGQIDTDAELARRHLAEVQAAAGKAAELTRRLLAFGRRQVLDRTVLDLNDVVADARRAIARSMNGDVRLVMDLEPHLPCVRADRGQLVQVLASLASNACDAMADGGTLTIRTAAADGEVLLSVSDTGVGMGAETRARIFEPFFTTKQVGEGTGLGLAMVHGIVQQSDGRLSVESEPGNGTTFTLALPATDDEPEPAVTRAAPAPGGSETVLLVEDEPVVRRLTAEMLTSLGYRVLSAASPDEALAVTEPWELLLSDVVMPAMSGPELAKRLAAGRPGAAVLFTSGYSGAAAADRAELGADLLEKPFTLDELACKVRAALDARPAS